jgi:hypothetical protein
MTDNQLFAFVKRLIESRLTARGLAGFVIARAYQPDQQGANTAPTIYLFKVGPDRRFGSPRAGYAWDALAGSMVATETQVYESTFQASIDMLESTDPEGLTPSDAINAVAAIMQSDTAVAELQAGGVGVLRVSQVLNPYNVNDRDQFDANSSFDFVLSYERVFVGTAEVVAEFEGLNVVRVPDVPPTVRETEGGRLRILADGFTLRIVERAT